MENNGVVSRNSIKGKKATSQKRIGGSLFVWPYLFQVGWGQFQDDLALFSSQSDAGYGFHSFLSMIILTINKGVSETMKYYMPI